MQWRQPFTPCLQFRISRMLPPASDLWSRVKYSGNNSSTHWNENWCKTNHYCYLREEKQQQQKPEPFSLFLFSLFFNFFFLTGLPSCVSCQCRSYVWTQSTADTSVGNLQAGSWGQLREPQMSGAICGHKASHDDDDYRPPAVSSKTMQGDLVIIPFCGRASRGLSCFTQEIQTYDQQTLTRHVTGNN